MRDNSKERTDFASVRSFARWGLIVYLDICCGQLCSVGQENMVQLAQDDGRLRQKLIPVIQEENAASVLHYGVNLTAAVREDGRAVCVRGQVKDHACAEGGYSEGAQGIASCFAIAVDCSASA